MKHFFCLFLVATVISLSSLFALADTCDRKSTDQTVSSFLWSDLRELGFTVPLNEQRVFETHIIFVDSSGVMDFRLVGPEGSEIDAVAVCSQGGSLTETTVSQTEEFSCQVNGEVGSLLVRGSVANGATQGRLSLQARRFGIQGSVHAGSSICWTKAQ